MSFSFLGNLAGLLPNYVQGQRQAVADNWNDLLKYNQAQAGQLSNAFNFATWQPRLDMAYDNGIRSGIATTLEGMNLGTQMSYWPASMLYGQAHSEMAPFTAPAQAWGEFQAWMNALKNQQYPQNGQQNAQFAQPPSSVR